jgi:hypothetical protein
LAKAKADRDKGNYLVASELWGQKYPKVKKILMTNAVAMLCSNKNRPVLSRQLVIGGIIEA